MEKRKLGKYENKLLFILFLTFGFVFFDRLAITYLIPFIQKDIPLSNTQIGLLMSGLALTWGISSQIVGFLSDKIGKKRIFLISAVILFSISSFSTGLPSTFISLLAIRMFMGIWEGPVLPLTLSIMAVESSENRRGFNMGILQNASIGFWGMLVAPIVVVALANAFGWRLAFYSTVIPGLIIALLIYKFVREPKTVSEDASGKKIPVRLKDVFKFRNVVISIFAGTLFNGWYMMLIAFAPMFLVTQKQFSPSLMSIAMSAIGVGAVLSFLFTSLSDRLGRKPIVLSMAVVNVISPLLLVYTTPSLPIIVLISLLFGLGLGAFPLMLSAIPAESVPAIYIASAIGIINGIAEIFGGVITPTVAGIFADQFGLSFPMYLCAAFAFLGLLISLMYKETAPIKWKKQEGISQIL
ncbi:MFS transporter [Bacillus sp. OK048]|uniref:MFS transporter n=1 Tax=Bacillus sp. OK048 TaxID=1882761 RepID=UPI00088665BC|nr:MFS transporter [Bacillus sp. OK048]SDM48181.1 Sugar phosphate permease [Bacillus sp. OK048]